MGEGFCAWCNRIRAVDERQIGTTQHTGPECPVCKDFLIMSKDSKYLSKKQVAEMLSISPSTVERNVKRGTLPQPSYQLGVRSPRWSKEDIEILMETED